MGRVDLQRARARLAAERRELEQAPGHRRHQDDGDDAGLLEPRNLAADLYLDELERLGKIFAIGSPPSNVPHSVCPGA